ncbi:hypothetical protein OVA24_20625 [Luteolibacter sp. SL250]|nr:hypothetical protein [Luteolibacter sp. SL250]WAC19628.1 hypothetical protein OVA24_20625 [Luteolibacter sp. SL250]
MADSSSAAEISYLAPGARQTLTAPAATTLLHRCGVCGGASFFQA